MNDEVNPQGQPKGAARSAETARSLIRKAKRATRRRFSSEDEHTNQREPLPRDKAMGYEMTPVREKIRTVLRTVET
jgi:hypothetical protein